jgi:hypothetical protein
MQALAAAAPTAPLPPPRNPFAALPLEVTAAIFALLPPDTRLLCRGVCRGWRDALSEARLWASLDLSSAARLVHGDATSALLRAASARAAGQLAALNVSGCARIRHDALLRVVGANGGALRELAMCSGDGERAVTVEQLEALLQAGPQLRALHADVACGSVAEARALLAGIAAPCALAQALTLLAGVAAPSAVTQQRYGPLCIRSLTVSAADAGIQQLAAALPAHAPLQELRLMHAPLHEPGALHAVVDACLECSRVHSVRLDATRLGAAAAPQLARLLRAGTRLRDLHLEVDARWPAASLLDDAGAALIADALRANVTLTSLRLVCVALWETPQAAETLLAALVGHPSLRLLVLWGVRAGADAATAIKAGAAVAALLSANAPALEELVVSRCGLGEAGLRPLLAALPGNAHLRSLEVEHDAFSDAFARNALLPAVRANAGLRRLLLDDAVGAARDAMALVDSRAAGGGAPGGGGVLPAQSEEDAAAMAAVCSAANISVDLVPRLLTANARVCEEESDEVWDALAFINGDDDESA